MYRKFIQNTIVLECIGSLLLSSCFIVAITTFVKQKGIDNRTSHYFSSQEEMYSLTDPPLDTDEMLTDNRGNLLYSLSDSNPELTTIARQVSMLSFVSVPKLPLEAIVVVAQTAMLRKKANPIPRNVNYARIGRYSSLHKAYQHEFLEEYAILENYLLYSLEKGDYQSIAKSNIAAMRSYILKVNPRVSFQYADTVANKIIEVAQKYNLPFILLGGLIGTESTYNKEAVSNVGAAGLTQVYPKVWKKALIDKGLISSIKDLYTIEKGIEAGAYILNSYYSQGRQMKHANPLRYALHRYYGARDNAYVERVYKHSQRIAQQLSLLG